MTLSRCGLITLAHGVTEVARENHCKMTRGLFCFSGQEETGSWCKGSTPGLTPWSTGSIPVESTDPHSCPERDKEPHSTVLYFLHVLLQAKLRNLFNKG